MIDPTEKRFTTSMLVAAAGCEIGTFQKWRSRNGLFPETIGAQGWNKFSLIDVCVVRLIVVLTQHRLVADQAVHAAQAFGRSHMLEIFQRSDRESRFVGLYAGDPSAGIDPTFVYLQGDQTVASAMRSAAGAAYSDPLEPLSGVLTVIDFHWIAIHVIGRIKLTEPDLLTEGIQEVLPWYGNQLAPAIEGKAAKSKTKSLPKPKPRKG